MKAVARTGRRQPGITRHFLALMLMLATTWALVGEVGHAAAAGLVIREGTIRVLAADTVDHHDGQDPAHDHAFHGTSEDVYKAVLVGNDGHMYFLAGQPQFPNNQQVRVAGTLSGQVLNADSVTPIASAKSVAGTSTMPTAGTTNVLVMLAYWTTPDSVTPESAAAQLFGDSNGWYRDSSYGALGQSGVVTPWMHINPPAQNLCYGDSDSIMSQAKTSAEALGYNLGAYDNVIVYFPYDGDAGSDCARYAGWAWVGAPGTWLNGYLDRRVTVHEQGHNYGLWHGHSLMCAGPIDTSCAFADYGNDYDAMGSSNYVGHFTASQKSQLGWMNGRTQDLSAGGSTTLAPYETDSVTTVAAVVNANADRSYWLEYRQPRDFDSDLPSYGTDGVMITVKDPTIAWGGDGASILDTRPGDGADVTSSTLRAGETWVSDEGIRFTAGSVTGASATVTVTRPAPPTLVSIGDAAISEGSSGNRSLRFNVSLSRPSTTNVTVAYRTEGGTATAGADYTAVSGTVAIPAGSLSAAVSVPVRGDKGVEPRETFGIVLSAPIGAELGRTVGTGRIFNDDPMSSRRIGIGDASIVEGDGATRSLRFTVALSSASTSSTSVAYATASGTAQTGGDFGRKTGRVTIRAGATSATVSIPIMPDTEDEGTETFTIKLSSPSNVQLGRTLGTGTILNDD